MRTAQLLAMTTSAHVDLSHVGATASDTHGMAAQRRLTPEERKLREERHEGIEIVPTVSGKESRTYRRPAWSMAECGHAAAGLGELPWFAARYSYAGDRTCYWTLWYGLVFQAQRMARREGWQPRVPGRLPRDPQTEKPIAGAQAQAHFYLLDLAQLVLDEDGCHDHFVLALDRYALYMQVEIPCWQRVLEPRYRALQAVYDRWLGIARGMIQRRLNAPES
jgi:hypothetical protein